MKKYIIILLCFINVIAKGQCDSTLGPIYSDTCIFYSLNPPIQVNEIVTKCFIYTHNASGGINLSYLIVNSFCGPISPYNYLNFELYNDSCDTLIASGQIVPNPINVNITPQLIDSGVTYRICLTWKAKCTQFAICPLLYQTALPVTLLDFEAKNKRDYIELKWSTATEKDNDYFVIQKSDDAEDFTTITTIKGVGNSNIKQNYLYNDLTILNKITYYKLLQVDYNGQVTNLKTVAVKPSMYILKTPVKVINILGQEVDTNYNGFKIILYSDGTFKKN
tara:strand:- start:664 stop:1497 length:834 start_codon:yes stop_codon:yes gene_type:complete